MEAFLDIVAEFGEMLQCEPVAELPVSELPAGRLARLREGSEGQDQGEAAAELLPVATADAAAVAAEDEDKVVMSPITVGDDVVMSPITDDEPPSPFKDFYDLAASSGSHPWAVRGTTRGRSSNLSADELERLRMEQRAAEASGMSWQERGPAGSNRPSCWRGQTLRKGADGGQVRYANRGSRNKEYYTQMAREGRLVKTGVGKTRVDKGKGKEKSANAGSDKGKGKGDGKSDKGKGM